MSAQITDLLHTRHHIQPGSDNDFLGSGKVSVAPDVVSARVIPA